MVFSGQIGRILQQGAILKEPTPVEALLVCAGAYMVGARRRQAAPLHGTVSLSQTRLTYSSVDISNVARRVSRFFCVETSIEQKALDGGEGVHTYDPIWSLTSHSHINAPHSDHILTESVNREGTPSQEGK